MSSIPISAAPDSAVSERRAHPRRRLNQLAYIGFGPDSGGVLLDISIGGLRCQIIGAVVQGQRCRLKFALPGRPLAIETDGQVVWSNKSRRGGGVRLLEMGEDIRQQIQLWIGGEIPSAAGEALDSIPLQSEPMAAVEVPLSPGEAGTLVPAPDAAVMEAVEPLVFPPGPSERPAQTDSGQLLHLGIAAVPTAIEALPIAFVHALPRYTKTGAVVLAPDTPTTKIVEPPVSVPAQSHPPAQLGTQPKLPVAIPQLKPRTQRATRILAVAACAVFGFAALVLSRFDLASVMDLVSGDNRSSVLPPAGISPPKPPASVAGPRFQTGLLNEYTLPRLSGDAAGYASTAASEPARRAAPASNPVTAPSVRPVQRPPAAVGANRQQLAMASPRPSTTSPTPPPAAALPETAPAVIAAPPVALMDTPPSEARLAELVQPVRPPTVTTYRQPELTTRVEPVYSRFAREARLQGTVQISATIGLDGVPRSLARVSGNAALAEMAMNAMRRWIYQPAVLNGQPTDSHVVINFSFQLR